MILPYVMETKRKGVTSTPVHANLREALLRDTLVRAVDNEVDSYQIVIDNIGTFVELVYHQNFTNETMQCKPDLLIIPSTWTKMKHWQLSDPSSLVSHEELRIGLRMHLSLILF